MLSIGGIVRCVSDLHLRAERPDLTERFAAFLADTATAGVEALFILGDLFEYWIGDDDLADPFNARVSDLLSDLANGGTRIYFIAGNRDFLIGATFAAVAGIQLLGAVEKVRIGGSATLLMHGDTVCTDDLPYQQFRRLVRTREWQENFLARPLVERRAEMANLRRQSAAAMQDKTEAIMDTNIDAIRAALAINGCSRLIHGHTHRPGHQEIKLASGAAERWVLSDWDTQRGDALELSAGGVRRIDLSR